MAMDVSSASAEIPGRVPVNDRRSDVQDGRLPGAPIAPSVPSGPAIASVETLTQDRAAGVISPFYTSSEELAVSGNSDNLGKNISGFSGLAGPAGPVGEESDTLSKISTKDEKKEVFDKKGLLRSLDKYGKLLKKMLEKKDKAIGALRDAMNMAIAGVPGLIAVDSNLVSGGLKQGNLNDSAEMSKKNSAILNPTASNINKMPEQMVAIGLLASVKTISVQPDSSTSRQQDQPKDIFNKSYNEMGKVFKEGNATISNLAEQSKNINDKKTVNS